MAKWNIRLYTPGRMYKDEFGTWFSQMKLGKKTSLKRRERYIQRQLKEKLYYHTKPIPGRQNDDLIPVNPSGYGALNLLYKMVKTDACDDVEPKSVKLHSNVAKLIDQGFAKEDILKEFHRVKTNNSTAAATPNEMHKAGQQTGLKITANANSY